MTAHSKQKHKKKIPKYAIQSGTSQNTQFVVNASPGTKKKW